MKWPKWLNLTLPPTEGEYLARKICDSLMQQPYSIRVKAYSLLKDDLSLHERDRKILETLKREHEEHILS